MDLVQVAVRGEQRLLTDQQKHTSTQNNNYPPNPLTQLNKTATMCNDACNSDSNTTSRHANLIRLLQCLEAGTTRFTEARTIIASGERWYWPAEAAAALGICSNAQTPLEYLARCIIWPRRGSNDETSRAEIFELMEFMLQHPFPGISNQDAVFDTLVKVSKEVAQDCLAYSPFQCPPMVVRRWYEGFFALRGGRISMRPRT